MFFRNKGVYGAYKLEKHAYRVGGVEIVVHRLNKALLIALERRGKSALFLSIRIIRRLCLAQPFARRAKPLIRRRRLLHELAPEVYRACVMRAQHEKTQHIRVKFRNYVAHVSKVAEAF